MIKLICYGSKTLHLKEAYRSYAGERKFTNVEIIAANEIDGHKLSSLTTNLHILLGTEEDIKVLNFKDDNTAEYLLDEKYTENVGTIGFYLKFTQGEADEEAVGLTNTIYIDINDNRINQNVTTGGSSIGGGTGINGKNGVTYVPKVSEDGILSWTNDGGLPNPTPVNIKGKDVANEIEVDEMGDLSNGDKIASVKCVFDTVDFMAGEFGKEIKNKADKSYVDEKLGDIETALDSIIAIQENLMGGATE